MSKELRMTNGRVVDADSGKACRSCGTPRFNDRYKGQWIDAGNGVVACPTCGTEMENEDE